MRIIVYEHISSGGYAGRPISPSALSEGFGMLRTIVSDLKAADHEVTVIFDDRLSKLNPPINADYVVPILYSEEPKNFLVNIAKINEASYIIAPETEKTLQTYVELMEQIGKVSLNCESSAIEKVADKAALYETLKKHSLPTPETTVLDVNDSLSDARQTIRSKLSYPVVFKPVDGVSCGGLSIVKEDNQVEKAIAKIKAQSANKHFLVQELIKGEAASVSLICAKGKASAISLNQQMIKVGAPAEVSGYEGGVVPLDHPLKQQALKLAKKAVECFPGLRGYVGLDMILAKDKAFVMDVNPRLTTSYVGLSRIANSNIAQALVNSVLKDRLPSRHENNSYVYFSKIETPKPTISTFQKVAHLSEVVSPPFPLNDNPTTYALIAGQGNSLKAAELKLEEAEKSVLNIISRGK